jgi:hypothetical protein
MGTDAIAAKIQGAGARLGDLVIWRDLYRTQYLKQGDANVTAYLRAKLLDIYIDAIKAVEAAARARAVTQ